MTPATRTTLPNGLRVILAENPTVPLVFFSWAWRAGFACDPPGREGLASFVPGLLREAREVDDLCAEIAAGCDWDHAFLNVGLLTRHLVAGIDLLIDMACSPRISPEAVARVRQRRLAAIDQSRGDAREIASQAFADAVFGSSVYAHPPLGTAASVQRIEAADVVAFHRMHYAPSSSYLVIAGSFDREQVIARLGSVELPAIVDYTEHPASVARPTMTTTGDTHDRFRLVDVAHATRTEIRIGCADLASVREQLPALEVCHLILGSGPDSRLARRVRQRHGLTYDIRSRVHLRGIASALAIETNVAHEAAAAALAAIREEIETFTDTRVPESDVDTARQRLLGTELRRYQDLMGLGASLGPIALQREDDDQHDREDWFERRREAIAAVGPEAVRDAAAHHLHPDRLVTILAGPAGELPSQFASDRAYEPGPLASTS
jgi:zinc protease